MKRLRSYFGLFSYVLHRMYAACAELNNLHPTFMGFIAFLIVLFWFSVEIILTSVIILTDIIPFASVSPFFRVLTYSWECIDAAVVSAMAYSRIYE